MFVGDKDGIDVWYKLGTSDDESVKNYFNNVRTAAQKFRTAFFSDFVEQKKKPLNNQKTYMMYFSDGDKKWHIDIFSVPV